MLGWKKDYETFEPPKVSRALGLSFTVRIVVRRACMLRLCACLLSGADSHRLGRNTCYMATHLHARDTET